MRPIVARTLLLAALTATATACQDSALPLESPAALAASAVKFWDGNATTTWNARATTQLAVLPNGSHAPASRMLTYLSIAQYRAALAAEAAKDGAAHPSVSAAIGAASVVVLSSFFPTAAATFEAQLDADLAGPQWPGAQNRDAGSGEAIGRVVAASVLAIAATDGFNTQSPGAPPVGPGYWVSSAAPIARSFYGTRPWFMSSTSELRAPPPPAFGSPAFLAALAEVRAISDTRTAEQLAIAQAFNQSAAPFTPGGWNVLAVDLIRRHRRTEREAARILAYANAAAFDAQIACFDTKFAYWFIRPSQADPAITLPIGLPNHPSYPSAHSCITSSILTVLADALPGEAAGLAELIEQAGLSRMYGGIHYRFDLEAGQEIGRRAAALALAGSLE